MQSRRRIEQNGLDAERGATLRGNVVEEEVEKKERTHCSWWLRATYISTREAEHPGCLRQNCPSGSPLRIGN